MSILTVRYEISQIFAEFSSLPARRALPQAMHGARGLRADGLTLLVACFDQERLRVARGTGNDSGYPWTGVATANAADRRGGAAPREQASRRGAAAAGSPGAQVPRSVPGAIPS